MRSDGEPVHSELGWVLDRCRAGYPGAADAATAQPVQGLRFSADGKHLAAAAGTAKGGGSVVVWNVEDRKPVVTHVEAKGCTDVCFSSDGKRLAFGTASPRVGILEFTSGMLLRAWDAHKDIGAGPTAIPAIVYAVAFTPDGKLLATAGSDWMAVLWNVADGTPRRALTGNGQAVMGLALAPDGRRLLTGGLDHTVRLWDVETGELQRPFWTQQFYLRRVQFSHDGRHFLSTSYDGTRIRETATGNVRAVVGRNAQCAELSPDARLLAAAGGQEGVQVFPIDLRPPHAKQAARIATLIKQFENDDYELREAASRELEQIGMPAEPQLRAGMKSSDAEARVRCRAAHRHVMSPGPIATLERTRNDAAVVCFSPDGKLLAAGFGGGNVKLWRVDRFEEVATLRAAPAK